MNSKLVSLVIKLYQQFWYKMNFLRPLNSERLNHLLKAINQSESYFCICPSVSGPEALKSMWSAIFNFSGNVRNIFEIGLKKCGVIVEILLSNNTCFEIKNFQTPFCCLYITLGGSYCPNLRVNVTNKFLLTCNFQKGPPKNSADSHI